MSSDIPPGLAQILAEVVTGQLSESTRSTVARALRAASDGRPIAEILATSARERRDDALRDMCRRHFASLAPSAAAKAMAKALRRYADGSWPRDYAAASPPRAGTLDRSGFDVLVAGAPPGWRTVLTVLQRYPLSAANGSAPQGSMDDGT